MDEVELGTQDDYTRWATALIEDWLPQILEGLIEDGPAGTADRPSVTLVDAVELRRRDALVERLRAACHKAGRALEGLEGLLAYADFQEKGKENDDDDQLPGDS